MCASISQQKSLGEFIHFALYPFAMVLQKLFSLGGAYYPEVTVNNRRQI